MKKKIISTKIKRKLCPKCLKLMETDKKFCTKCGTELLDEILGKCPYCNAKIDLDDKFCGKCGKEVIGLVKNKVDKKIKLKKKSEESVKKSKEEISRKVEERDVKSFEKEYESKIELPIKDHLTNGERVVCKHGDYYATNKRVLKVKKQFLGGVDLEDLAYRHISSLQLKSDINGALVVFGVLIMLGSIIFTFVVRISSPQLIIFGFIFGFLFIIFGLLLKINYYLLRGTGGEQLKINAPDKLSAKNFVKTIRDYLKGF